MADQEVAAIVRRWQQPSELAERFDNRIERAVDIKVIRLDGHDRANARPEIVE